jgi:uncharacterized membrane protein
MARTPDPSVIPRWARIAVAVLGIVCFAGTVVVSIFTDDIADFLTARIGFWGVIGGSLTALVVILWIASRLDD